MQKIVSQIHSTWGWTCFQSLGSSFHELLISQLLLASTAHATYHFWFVFWFIVYPWYSPVGVSETWLRTTPMTVVLIFVGYISPFKCVPHPLFVMISLQKCSWATLQHRIPSTMYLFEPGGSRLKLLALEKHLYPYIVKTDKPGNLMIKTGVWHLDLHIVGILGVCMVISVKKCQWRKLAVRIALINLCIHIIYNIIYIYV